MASNSHTKQIRWLHIPKAGQSFFLTTLLYACRGNVSLVDEVHGFLSAHRNLTRKLQHVVKQFRIADFALCPGFRTPVIVGHAGISGDATATVGLLRQPRQRLLSFCASSRAYQGGLFKDCLALSVSGHLGVVVLQLSGLAVGNSAKPLPLPLTKSIVREALGRLARLRFIGLQEEWASSVALFHTVLMPSTPVVASEEANIHETPARDRSTALSIQQRHNARICSEHPRYGEAVLDALPPTLQDKLALDPDQILHAYAVMVFCAHMRKALPTHHVASCHRPCPLVYVTPRTQASNTRRARNSPSFEQRASFAAKRLVAHWGLDDLPLAHKLVAFLQGQRE